MTEVEMLLKALQDIAKSGSYSTTKEDIIEYVTGVLVEFNELQKGKTI